MIPHFTIYHSCIRLFGLATAQHKTCSFQIQSITFRIQQFAKRDLITISIYFTSIYLYPVQKKSSTRIPNGE